MIKCIEFFEEINTRRSTYYEERRRNAWALFLLLLAGIVLGGFIGMLADGVSSLNWLSYGQTFGLDDPVVLNLGLLVVTFGLTIKITIASIIGVIVAIFIYRFL